jgi:hypothetical protein
VTAANSRFAQSRFSASFLIFFTKNNYLGGKNAVRFLPRLGKAAKRYQQQYEETTIIHHSIFFGYTISSLWE